MRKIWGAAGLAALALAVSACGSSSSSSAASGSTPAAAGSSPAASASASSSRRHHLDRQDHRQPASADQFCGLHLYWFAPDTSTTSKCTGSCATYWPPVKGPATAVSGVTGTLGTITRSDGTHAGHLRRASAVHLRQDTAPGQATGNGLNLSGGCRMR